MKTRPLKIGFIGLGIMGTPMAGHLLAGGHQLIVHARGKMAQAIAKSRATQGLDARGVAQRAAQLGDAARGAALARTSPTTLMQRDGNGRTPLQLARTRGFEAMVRMLVAAGARRMVGAKGRAFIRQVRLLGTDP